MFSDEVVGIEFPRKFLASKELSDEILAKNACLFVMRCSTCSIESSIHPHPTSISKTETLFSLDAILRLVAPEEDDDTQPRIPTKYLVLQTWYNLVAGEGRSFLELQDTLVSGGTFSFRM